MHYFSPVDKIELLEIIRTQQTSDDTVCLAVSVGLKQGKIVIVVNDGPGFYTTRLLIFSSVEVFCLLQEGLSPKQIDQATKKFGFHVGLATLFDEFGIDIIAYITFHLQNIFGERLTNSSVIELFKIFVKNNLFGRKSKQGLYIYQDGKNKEVNPKLKELIENSLIKTKEV
jgi:enoyl-CoA hydratase/long-chain 3-hydroxyacyl-CoA dehydrogenase